MGDELLRRWPGDFFDVAGDDGCQEGTSRWTGKIGTLDDGYGWREEDAKGLGSIGLVLAERSEGVLLRPGVSTWF